MNKNFWPVTYRWAAVGTLIAYSAIGTKTFNVAYAQDVQKRASQSVRRFDIEDGPLDSVLTAFDRASGCTTEVIKPGIRAIHSHGVSGTYTPEQALQKLLDGTGLTFHFTSKNAVVIEIKNASATVDVTASVDVLAGSSPKYSQPALDTPQTITSVTQATMQEQGVTTLRDALRNVAGISLAAGEGGSQGDNLTIRGFTARNDLFIDGMRDFGSYYRDPFNTQEVEVLQGPSSVTFGRGSTGGVVNQATKSPSLSQFISGDFDLGTDLTRRLALDVNVPVPALGKSAAFRLNLMGDEGNVAERDVAENRRFGIAPSLAWGLGTDTRFTLSYFHQTATTFPITASRGSSTARRPSTAPTTTASKMATTCAPTTTSAPPKPNTT